MTTNCEAKSLITERDKIETRIEENLAILKANDSTMDSPLVDTEGFPISTIDVYSVRRARNEIICLRNDHAALTKQIAEAIESIHAVEEIPKIGSEASMDSNEQSSNRVNVHRTSNAPFAKVSSVTSNSPASESGLKLGDYIIQFGNIHFGTFVEIKQLTDETAHSEGKILRVTVLRNGRPLRLEIHPRRWSGPGLLGCGIIPETTTKII